MMHGYITFLFVLMVAVSITTALYLASDQSFATLLTEFRELNSTQSILLANSCVFIGLEDFAHDQLFSPSELSVSIASSSCVIDSMTVSTSSLEIHTSAAYHGTYAGAIGDARVTPIGDLQLLRIQSTTAPP